MQAEATSSAPANKRETRSRSTMQPPVLLEVPNIFTPNGDFSNDVFFIHSENLKSLSGSIVNRWGNTLLEFDSIDFTWDGEVNGQKVNEGTYFVIYKGIGWDQQIYEGQSFLQLVR